MHLSNPQNVILDIYTALLPFIMDLVLYDFVIELLWNTPIDGKFWRNSLSKWHTNRVEQ